ncbi:MAG: group III truncated hemoglobin [Flavobacteriales bacterium]|nr:group III truncated hemoglobin [Flavobacteriales bacterium]
MKNDILNLDDIKLLVDTFYDNVRKDELIGPIFDRIIEGRWPQHLEKMYRFWQTVLLEEHTYYGSPFGPHAKLPVNLEHFERWIGIFSQTVDQLFTGDKADEAKMRATKMAQMFHHKIEYYKNNSANPLIP